MNMPRVLAVLACLLSLALNLPVRAEWPNLSQVTGLAVDLGSQSIEPAMAIRILSEDGKVIYGEMAELSEAAAADLIDRGMAAFATSWKEVEQRCGSAPLIVKGLRVQGADIVVSRGAADQIRQANEQRHFLDHWQVAVIATQPQAGKPQPEVMVIGQQDLPSDNPDAAPPGLRFRSVPRWRVSPEQRQVWMQRFARQNPRWAARMMAMQQLTPQERHIVSEFFQQIAQLPQEQRRHLRREFRAQYPDIARKLQAFLQDMKHGQPGRPRMRGRIVGSRQ